MRALGWTLAVVAVAAAGGFAYAWHWSQPLLALRDIRTAMVDRDPVMLDPLVEWPTLRASVLFDANKEIEQKNDGKFLEFLRNWIGSEIAEDKVAISGTPKGLIRLACDNKADGDFEATKNKPCIIEGESVDYGYEPKNHERFQMTYRTKQGAVMRFIMGKNAKSQHWQLINLQWVKRAGTAA